MVKGVNKTVIEVNDTGSKMFEKIVFYVTPQYGTLTAKQLRRAAREFTFSFDENRVQRKPLRKRMTKKRRIKLFAVLGLIAATVGTALIIIL